MIKMVVYQLRRNDLIFTCKKSIDCAADQLHRIFLHIDSANHQSADYFLIIYFHNNKI